MNLEDDFDSISLDVEIEKINSVLSNEAAKRNRLEELNAPKRMCSKNQLNKIKVLTYELGLGQISKERERRLRRMSFAEVSEQIMKLKVRLDTAGPLSDRAVVGDMASNKAVNYLLELRARAHNSPRGDERLAIWSASKAEIQKQTQLAMKELQDFNDEHGVPIPAWRLIRGF